MKTGVTRVGGPDKPFFGLSGDVDVGSLHSSRSVRKGGGSAGMLRLCDDPPRGESEPVKLNRIPIRPWLLVVLLALAPLSSAEWKEKVLYSRAGAQRRPLPGVVCSISRATFMA